MTAINESRGKMTIVIVAHRLCTVPPLMRHAKNPSVENDRSA